MTMMRRIAAALFFAALMALAHQSGAAESDTYCLSTTATGTQWQPCGTGTPLASNPALVNYSPANVSIAAQDTGSSTATVANNQVYITGTPTANSVASFALANGFGTMRVQVTGTWTGTLATEVSMDGGTTWVAKGVHQIGTAITTSSYTGNFSGEGAIAGVTNVRVRATATWTGTAIVKMIVTIVDEQVYVGNPLMLIPSATAALGIAPTVAGSAASSAVLKAAPGNLYGVYATCTAACWLMVFNSTTAPSNGSTTSGVASGNMQDCIPIAAGGEGSISYGPGPPEVFSTGITAVISSSACTSLTLAATGFIHGAVQ
jgi:hypothetical protein